MPLGGLESPAGFGVSLLDESYASTLKDNLPLCVTFLGKLIDEGGRVRNDAGESEDDEVEVEEEKEEDINWGLKEGLAVNKFIISNNFVLVIFRVS